MAQAINSARGISGAFSHALLSSVLEQVVCQAQNTPEVYHRLQSFTIRDLLVHWSLR